MTALAEGFTGLALAAGLAMLCARQLRGAFICFAAQSTFVAAVAILAGQPLLALAPAASVAAVWLLRSRTPIPRDGRRIAGIAAGAVLALLSLSEGDAGIALAVVLLAVVLAALRRDAVTRLLALGAMGNGIVLAGCLVAGGRPAASRLPSLPLPMAASLAGLAPGLVETGRRWARRGSAAWLGWAELGGAAGLFAASLIVPLGALASVFAPLIAFDGVVRAWIARVRPPGPAVAPGGIPASARLRPAGGLRIRSDAVMAGRDRRRNGGAGGNSGAPPGPRVAGLHRRRPRPVRHADAADRAVAGRLSRPVRRICDAGRMRCPTSPSRCWCCCCGPRCRPSGCPGPARSASASR